MKIYRFAALGADTYVGGVRMNRFGQRFQMDEKVAQDAQRGGAVLLEESEFKAFGFTDEDLKVWGSPFMSVHDIPGNAKDAAAKAEFLDKVHLAQALYISTQQSLLEPHERNIPFTPSELVEIPKIIEIFEEVA